MKKILGGGGAGSLSKNVGHLGYLTKKIAQLKSFKCREILNKVQVDNVNSQHK